MLTLATETLGCVAAEMQNYIDQHSEAWQESQAGESLAEMLESVEDALANLEDISPQTHQSKTVIT